MMRETGSSEELLDRIYEAALVPDLWPDVLDRVAQLGRAEGGVLYAVTPQWTSAKDVSLAPIPRWTASNGIVEHVEAFVRDGWLHGNVRAERAVALNAARFVSDHDLFTSEEIENAPFYRYARQRGMGWHLGLSVQVPTGDVMIFNFERRHDEGPVESELLGRFDGLKAHLSRSSLLSSRLGLERARAGAESFALLGLPAAVLSAGGGAIVMNDLFEALMPAVVVDQAKGRLRLRDDKADLLLQDALSTIAAPGNGQARQVLSVPLKATAHHTAMVVHAIPIRRTARDIFAAASSVLMITPVCRATIPSASVIQGLFDLTGAEARIAQRIARGDSIRDIAGHTSVSEATIRTQLKAIFVKTGISKQGALIGLLSNISPNRF